METRFLPLAQQAAQRAALTLLTSGQSIAAPLDGSYVQLSRFEPTALAQTSAPCLLLVADISQLKLLTPQPLAAAADLIVQHFWPGPVTLVLPALPALATPPATFAVTCPTTDGLRKIIRQSGPLLAESTVATDSNAFLGQVPLVLIDAQAGSNPVVPTVIEVPADHANVRFLQRGAQAYAINAVLYASGYTC